MSEEQANVLSSNIKKETASLYNRHISILCRNFVEQLKQAPVNDIRKNPQISEDFQNRKGMGKTYGDSSQNFLSKQCDRQAY